MPTTNPTLEHRINDRLDQIHRRLGDIAAIEANAAAVGGYGAKGEFEPERDRLTAETDTLLDQIEAIGGSPKFHPKP